MRYIKKFTGNQHGLQVPGLLAFNFLIGFVFWYGIEKVFLRDALAIGPTGISIIATLYLTITIVLDVPMSALADRWGRRNVLFVSAICFIASDIILGLSENFVMYLVGTVFWALFQVSATGTYEAILYDSLKAQHKERLFQKIDASARMLFMIGVAISSMVSGLLADVFGLRGAYFLSIIPLGIALVVLWKCVKEPSIVTDDELDDISHHGYIGHLRRAFGAVRHSPALLLVTFGTISLFFIQTPLFEFQQYIYIDLFPSIFLVGLFNGLSGWILAFGFYIATKKTARSDWLLLAGSLSVLFIGLLSNHAVLLPLIVVLLVSSLLENTLQTNLQHATSSRTRATVSSVVYLAGNILIIPFIFLFGFLAEEQSIWFAYFVNGIVLLVFLGLYIFLEKALRLRS